MEVSLDFLLCTGYLGDLRSGMSKAEVQALLGAPDDTGGESRRYPPPSIFLYGTVEIYFQQQPPGDLTGLWWDAGAKGAFRLTQNCVLVDWAFTPEWTLYQVQDYLRERDIPFECHKIPSPDLESLSLILHSGVRISFQGELLYGVSG